MEKFNPLPKKLTQKKKNGKERFNIILEQNSMTEMNTLGA